MLMFSRSARLEGDATPSVRIKSTTAERLSRRNRLDVVGWRFIHGPVAKGRRTGNERRHRPEPCQSPPFSDDAERQLSLRSESYRGSPFDDYGDPWRAPKPSGVTAGSTRHDQRPQIVKGFGCRPQRKPVHRHGAGVRKPPGNNLPAPGWDMSGVQNRAYDLALVRNDIGGNTLSDDDLNVETLYDDELVVAAGVNTSWVGRPAVSLAELIAEPWILSPPGLDEREGLTPGRPYVVTMQGPPAFDLLAFEPERTRSASVKWGTFILGPRLETAHGATRPHQAAY